MQQTENAQTIEDEMAERARTKARSPHSYTPDDDDTTTNNNPIM